MIEYKFKEDKILEELKKYVDRTYTQHYSAGDPSNPQTFETIAKIPERGLYFSIGNIIKYGDRAGMKDDLKKELFKIAHYAMLAIYCEEKMKGDNIEINK